MSHLDFCPDRIGPLRVKLREDGSGDVTITKPLGDWMRREIARYQNEASMT
jgi:hypothetical protein